MEERRQQLGRDLAGHQGYDDIPNYAARACIGPLAKILAEIEGRNAELERRLDDALNHIEALRTAALPYSPMVPSPTDPEFVSVRAVERIGNALLGTRSEAGE